MTWLWIEVIGEHAPHQIFVDIDAERQRYDVGDSRTAELGIAPFQFDDGGDEFLRGTFRSWTPIAGVTEQAAVFTFDQRAMKFEQGSDARFREQIDTNGQEQTNDLRCNELLGVA